MRRFIKNTIWVFIGTVIFFLLAEVFGFALQLYLSTLTEGLIFLAISVIAVILLKRQEYNILLFLKTHYKRLLVSSPLIVAALFFILFGILRPTATTLAMYPAYYLTNEGTSFASLWKDNFIFEYLFWFRGKD